MFKIDVKNLESIDVILKDIESYKDDLPGVLDEAGAILIDRIRKRFLDETAPDGSKWEPSRAGLERRARGDTGTLFDTGSLFHSIQTAKREPLRRAIEVNPNARNRVTGAVVAEYGAKLQSTAARPQRIFLGWNSEDAKVLEDLLVLRLSQKVLKP